MKSYLIFLGAVLASYSSISSFSLASPIQDSESESTDWSSEFTVGFQDSWGAYDLPLAVFREGSFPVEHYLSAKKANGQRPLTREEKAAVKMYEEAKAVIRPRAWTAEEKEAVLGWLRLFKERIPQFLSVALAARIEMDVSPEQMEQLQGVPGVELTGPNAQTSGTQASGEPELSDDEMLEAIKKRIAEIQEESQIESQAEKDLPLNSFSEEDQKEIQEVLDTFMSQCFSEEAKNRALIYPRFMKFYQFAKMVNPSGKHRPITEFWPDYLTKCLTVKVRPYAILLSDWWANDPKSVEFGWGLLHELAHLYYLRSTELPVDMTFSQFVNVPEEFDKIAPFESNGRTANASIWKTMSSKNYRRARKHSRLLAKDFNRPEPQMLFHQDVMRNWDSLPHGRSMSEQDKIDYLHEVDRLNKEQLKKSGYPTGYALAGGVEEYFAENVAYIFFEQDAEKNLPPKIFEFIKKYVMK